MRDISQDEGSLRGCFCSMTNIEMLSFLDRLCCASERCQRSPRKSTCSTPSSIVFRTFCATPRPFTDISSLKPLGSVLRHRNLRRHSVALATSLGRMCPVTAQTTETTEGKQISLVVSSLSEPYGQGVGFRGGSEAVSDRFVDELRNRTLCCATTRRRLHPLSGMFGEFGGCRDVYEP